MRRALKYGVLAAGVLARLGYGQTLAEQTSFRSMSVRGVSLYGVSVFSGYSTSAYPGSFGQAQTGAGLLEASVNYGASASVGWQRHRERTSLSMMYSGSYSGMSRYSQANGYSQSLSVSLVRTLSPKWSVNFSGSASDSTVAQFIFQPTALGVISQVPASFDDLAAAFSIGQFSSNQSAAMLASNQALQSPARTLLLGTRVLTYGANVSVGYARSARLSFHLSSFAAGGQHKLNRNVADTSYVMPHSIGFTGGMGMNYMLSPRTQVGIDVGAGRLMNRYQNAYLTNANASIGRKMGMHWFLRAYGGGSYTRSTTPGYGAPKQKGINGGGSLGFQTYRHTLIGSYDRSAMDAYGLTLGTTTNLTAAWSWHRPGSSWHVFTTFSQEQVRNTGYASLSGWQAGGGILESLNSHTQLTAQYVYMSNSGTNLGTGINGPITNLEVHGVRLAVSWSPQAR